MYGYMEVVCLILGPMLASQPCLHAFWVLTSLHLLSFLLFLFPLFFVRNRVNILFSLQKYWCKLYHMKSYNCTFVCKFIKICSSVFCIIISIIYAFFFTYIYSLFHLQHCLQSYCVNHSVFQYLS